MKLTRLIAGMLVILTIGSGCVSREAYDRQREIADHLRTIKTEQDISLSSLQGDVLALKGGYKSQSAVVTGLEALARATSTELQTMQTRIGGLGTDQLQLRAELGRINTQMSETVRLLERVTQQQATLDVSLTTLSQRVGDLKKPAVSKPMSSKLSDSPAIPDMSKLLSAPVMTNHPDRGGQPAIDNRTAVERAVALKNGQNAAVVQPTIPTGVPLPPSVVPQTAANQPLMATGTGVNSPSAAGVPPVSANHQGDLRGSGNSAIAVTPPSHLLKANADYLPQHGTSPIGQLSQEDVSPLLTKSDAPITEKKSDVPFWRVPFERLAALFSSSEATAQSTPAQPGKVE